MLGADRVKLRDVAGLLRALPPAWTLYRNVTAKQLAAGLAAEGVRTVNLSGTPWLDPAALRAVIARRATQDLDEDGESTRTVSYAAALSPEPRSEGRRRAGTH